MMRINEELIDEYMDPIEALETYILNSINKTEKAKFFGNNARLSAGDGNQYIEDSIGALEESANLGARAPEVRQILRARLIDGEQGAGAMQTLKNISYMSFLSNPTAAATQLGDVGFSAAQNGFFRSTKNLMKQMGRQKFGDKLKYDIDEIGLGKNVSAEIGNTGKGSQRGIPDASQTVQDCELHELSRFESDCEFPRFSTPKHPLCSQPIGQLVERLLSEVQPNSVFDLPQHRRAI